MSVSKLIFLVFFLTFTLFAEDQKQKVHALYIPLADHYAALVAYDRYASQMKYADFEIEKMKNWDLLRAYFQSGEVDMAFVMTPLAIDMYNEDPHFNWTGLMHRDANALAANELLMPNSLISKHREDRQPNDNLAKALTKAYTQEKRPIQVGLPHLLSTHAVVLYKYLKDNDVKVTWNVNSKEAVLGISLPPPNAPSFIKIKNSKSIPAAFEQSLPWADVVETEGYGKVIWYSKDVLPWKHGHVECIILSSKKSLENKNKALKEVHYFIHKAGADIQKAKLSGGKDLDQIVNIVRKYIPLHTAKAIRASLRSDLEVINYNHLNIDKKGQKTQESC